MFDWPVLKQYDEAHIARIALPLGPFPYHNEVMTGFEYTAAVGMIQEGMEPEGLRLVQAIRDRYDGAKRSPFDEAECGHHYARAMTSWSLPLALTGFHYDALAGEMRFRAADGPVSWFWSTGNAWGGLLPEGRGSGASSPAREFGIRARHADRSRHPGFRGTHDADRRQCSVRPSFGVKQLGLSRMISALPPDRLRTGSRRRV